MKDFLTGRNTPFPEEVKAEVNGKLGTIAEKFGERWLTLQEGHPLQRLWARDDGLATVELSLFGDAIQRMSIASDDWLKRELKKIKTGDPGNRAGSIFEVIGLSILQGDEQAVTPMARGNPGYDGILKRAHKPDLLLSLKSYGVSAREKEVQKEGRELEQKLIATLRRLGINGVSVLIIANKFPDSRSVWRELEKLDEAIATSLANAVPVKLGGGWGVMVSNLQDEFKPLSRAHLSYHFMLAIAHHPNELRNLVTKVDEGYANFRNNPGKQSLPFGRAILVRLPASASVAGCATRVREYFTNGDTLLDGVILYQPTVTMEKGLSSLTHYVLPLENPNARGRQEHESFVGIKANVFVGIVVNKPTSLVLTDGVRQLKMDKFHLFQTGNIYTSYRMQAGKPLNVNMRNIAPGFRQRAVIEDDNGSIILEGKFPPTDELMLLP